MNVVKFLSSMDSYKRLNDINQRVWCEGFTLQNLEDLNKIAEDIKNGTAVFERIPQAQQSGLSKGSKVLCSASVICRGCPRTESEVREIYDADDLIGEGKIQEILVENWARIVGYWFDFPEQELVNICKMQNDCTEGVIVDNGTESVVFFDINGRAVYKLISLKHYNVLRLALDRIIIHNALFPETALVVLGFGRDECGQFVVIVRQNYIEGDVVSEDERELFMMSMGFTGAGMDYGMHLNYRTNELYVGDLNEYNVIKGAHGVNVIDADCRLNVPTLSCGGMYSYIQPDVDFSQSGYCSELISVMR